jgi:hypothetical protein
VLNWAWPKEDVCQNRGTVPHILHSANVGAVCRRHDSSTGHVFRHETSHAVPLHVHWPSRKCTTYWMLSLVLFTTHVRCHLLFTFTVQKFWFGDSSKHVTLSGTVNSSINQKENLSGFFPRELPVVKISPERVTGPEHEWNGSTSGPTPWQIRDDDDDDDDKSEKFFI